MIVQACTCALAYVESSAAVWLGYGRVTIRVIGDPESGSDTTTDARKSRSRVADAGTFARARRRSCQTWPESRRTQSHPAPSRVSTSAYGTAREREGGMQRTEPLTMRAFSMRAAKLKRTWLLLVQINSYLRMYMRIYMPMRGKLGCGFGFGSGRGTSLSDLESSSTAGSLSTDSAAFFKVFFSFSRSVFRLPSLK